MERNIRRRLLTVLVFFVLSGLSKPPILAETHLGAAKNYIRKVYPQLYDFHWYDAHKKCAHHDGLLTIRDKEEADKVSFLRGWIGLHHVSNVWTWSTGKEAARTFFWDTDEPVSGNECVWKERGSLKWKTASCIARYPPLCMKYDGILVQEKKTWEEALEHCRELHRGLISLPERDLLLIDRDALRQDANTTEVWVGLRFLAGEWLWMSGDGVWNSSLPQCPAHQLHCGAIAHNDKNWKIMDCNEPVNDQRCLEGLTTSDIQHAELPLLVPSSLPTAGTTFLSTEFRSVLCSQDAAGDIMERNILRLFLTVLVFFVLSIFPVSSVVSGPSPTAAKTYIRWVYEFPVLLHWIEAAIKCKEDYDGLLTIRNLEDAHTVFYQKGWIGLRLRSNVWTWSAEKEAARTFFWDTDEPANECSWKDWGSLKWKTASCTNHRFGLCMKYDGILVQEKKTWEEALEHCRELHRDLISLPERHLFLIDRDALRQDANTTEVWVGLRFLAGEWLWMSGDGVWNSSLPQCPAHQLHCGAIAHNDKKWKIMDCSEKRNFLCSKRRT